MNQSTEDINKEAFSIPGYSDTNLYCQRSDMKFYFASEICGIYGECKCSCACVIEHSHRRSLVYYCMDALRSILAATKASNELPSAGDDFDYYSTFEGFRAVMLHKGQSLLKLMTSLIQRYGVREKFQGRELEEKYDLLIDVNDVILENVSNCLDEASGLKKSEEELIVAVKPQSVINTSWNKKQYNSSSQSFKLLAAKNISRPQLAFKDKIDNSNSLFVPIIKDKPNSIKPLAIILEKNGEKEEFCHPYEVEIEKFKVPEEFLENVEPIIPKPLEETPLIFIKTEEQLKKLCDELKHEKEIAVDLEHHSYRSFQGFACLMQISSREKDFIIDVLELRSDLHILNDVFTDPKIVKVLHGADMDVLWLQRDFGLYIVNLFDTGQASRVLHFAHLSLSYLLKHYCKLDLDKQFQLADWRIRPVPKEMIKYARQDTHYLLYVYDCLKNDLIRNGNETKNLLRSTFDRSKMICLKKYQKPLFSEDKYIDLCKRSKKILSAKQLYCLKELYSWRDMIARENDESLAYVLPNHMLLQIAQALPREQQGILACCNPIPPLVKQQLNEIHSIILKANESSLKQLAELELERKAQIHTDNNQIDLNNLLHCPHDIIHVEEKKSQTSQSSNSEIVLPLITKEESSVIHLRKKPSILALFESPPKTAKKSKGKTKPPSVKVSEILSKLISPFERYKMTEQLQMSQKKDNTEIEIIDDSIEEQSSTTETSPNNSNSVNANSIQSEQPSTSVEILDISCDMLTSTPLRRKNKKKKRKADPDVPFMITPINAPPPPKKSKSPEVVIIDDDSFKPYDYSQADYSAFTGKKKSKGTFKPQTQNDFKAPGKHIGRSKKHFKQASFGGEAKQSKKNWPQNR